MTTLIFVLLFIGICGSFFFAGVETGFVSWNPLKVSYRASQGDIYARWALHLLKYKEIFDRVDSVDTFSWGRDFGLSILNGVTKEMRINALVDYQNKIKQIIDKNSKQHLLKFNEG